MPYIIDKGPGIALIEQVLNTAPEPDLVKFVQAMRNGAPDVVTAFAETLLHPGQLAPNGNDPAWWYVAPQPGGNAMSMRDHFTHHWYVQPSTAWWSNFDGPVERIMAEAMARAVEISLGVDIPAAGAAPAAVRRWPIDMWWTCGAPRFDVQLTWMQPPAGPPLVRFLVITPGFEGATLFPDITIDPTTIDPAGKLGQYRLAPADARNYKANPRLDAPATYDAPGDGSFVSHSRGAWMVSARDHELSGPTLDELHAALATLPHVERILFAVRELAGVAGIQPSMGTPAGHVPPVMNHIRSHGPIVCVSVATDSGGVAPK
jgi:hypothetical protein